jgi:glycerate 2-kinase
MPRVVVAPNAFKGTLTAMAAAKAMADGVVDAVPGADVVLRPVADGGDGTVDCAVSSGFNRHEVTVAGPLGEPVLAAFAVRDDRAVLEMAQAAGLMLLAAPDPCRADTAGVGQLVRAALDAGARRILLGAGGSATTDGGAGMCAALGLCFLDAHGEPVPPGGAGLRELVRVVMDGRDPRLASTELTVAADVDNPLLGPTGAAAVFGPQKGADAADIAVLEDGLRTLVAAAEAARPGAAARAGQPGAGAAGGLVFGAVTFLDARPRPGADLLLEMVRFDASLEGADLVITGEGALDEQTLRGKAPLAVARRSRAAGVPVAAVCGRVDATPARWAEAGFVLARGIVEEGPAPVRTEASGTATRPHAPRGHAGPLRRRTAQVVRELLG